MGNFVWGKELARAISAMLEADTHRKEEVVVSALDSHPLLLETTLGTLP